MLEHFSGTTRKIESKAGRAAEDWKLSRFACYLIAQNGDPEKAEIAAAQSYFAIKTREAEIVKELTRLELLEMGLAAERGRLAAEAENEKAQIEKAALAAQIKADAGATALGKVIEESKSRNMRIGDFAKVLGDVGQNKYFEELRDEKIIMAFPSTLPYQRYLSAGYFRVTQVRGTGGAIDKWFPVTMITPKGQAYLAKQHKRRIQVVAATAVIEAQVSALV